MRTAIHEDRKRVTWFSVDQPSTRFASFGNPEITKVGCELEARLADMLGHLGVPVPPTLVSSNCLVEPG